MALSSTLSFAKSKQHDSRDDIKVMTFNIRCDNPYDGANNWESRKDRAAGAIRFYDADIVGMQEVKPGQQQFFESTLPGYTRIGAGRLSDGSADDEACPLWFKTERFKLIDSGVFWLSETPDSVGSQGWDAAYPRIAVWALLTDKYTGKKLLAMNTHLDHMGQTARLEGSRLLLDKIAGITGGKIPVVLTGDFNASPAEVPCRTILDPRNPGHLTDSREVAGLVYGPAWTYHGFGSIPYAERPVIDYLFVGGDLTVNRYGVLAETENEAFISDHAPVLISISL
ncbi:MAG: endonuclease/exonuclease/phosphatase family protein [Bacteroides sp.]|nr:endonuclease/exonuclease/phosphatase family protein [Bacteroides sp.]MCM1094869.1 endonuclease/exonuclease/phosphatase family protein [Terasakiella sp.]